MMCLFNHPVDALQLWNEHSHSMIEELFIDNDETALTLHLLYAIFRENGTSSGTLDQIEPIGDPPESENIGQINPPNIYSLNNEHCNGGCSCNRDG